jgi:hypothetical protein
MQRAVLMVLAAILATSLCHAIGFNEIMYDVLGSDDDQEWFELFNEKNISVDMTGWKFFEAGTNHNLVVVRGDFIVLPHEYFVVAEDVVTFLAMYPNYTGTLFDSTFSLSNTGEALVIRNKTGQVQDNLTYTFIWGGNENGYSVGIHNNIWKETFPTPGSINKVTNVCDWKVSILSDSFIFDSSTDFSWKVRTEKVLGEPALISIKRTVVDMYGNAIRTYADLQHNISNRETLTYEPNLKPGTYLVSAEITPSCNDTNAHNNADQRLFAIKDQRESASSIEIKNVYDLGKDKKAAFGQLIRLQLVAYKGDTTKNVVSLWIEGKEKVSKVFKFSIEDKFTEQILTIPIQIASNCDGKLKNGTYSIIAEGFGEEDKKAIEVYGNQDCPKPAKETKQTTQTKKEVQRTDPEQKTYSSVAASNEEKPFAISAIRFESSQRKAEKLVPYLLVFTSMIAITFLLFSSTGGL